MTQFLSAGGPFMWVILALGLVMLLSSTRSLVTILRRPGEVSRSRVNTVVHLGYTALVTGVFAQLLGLYQAAGEILRATAISPRVIAEGIFVSFNTTLFGLAVLFFSLLFWLVLRAMLERGSSAAN